MVNLKSIPLVILAGGKGTRIAEYSSRVPKPMIKIGNLPIIQHIINYYKYFGVSNFYIASGYKHIVLKKYFENQVNVKVINTGISTLTGGRILRLKKILPKTFFLTYGDGLSNVNLYNLYKLHLKMKTIATVTAVHPVARFGEIFIKKNFAVSFNEKPNVTNDWINGGFFIFNKEIFKYLKNDSTILEQSPLKNLAKKKELSVLKHKGFWQCMDTLREKIILEQLYKNKKKCPWIK